jgi:hypothetical protein
LKGSQRALRKDIKKDFGYGPLFVEHYVNLDLDVGKVPREQHDPSSNPRCLLEEFLIVFVEQT